MAALALNFRHHRVQRLRRLVGRASVRAAEGAFVVEGAKVVAAALDAAVELEALYVAPEATAAELAVAERAHGAGVRVFDLAPGVIERVAGTVTPQALLAVARRVDVGLDALAGATWIVMCVDVRDPGNAGTVLRSAEAAGADAVVCCEGTVDVYNPKTVRASAGAVFHVPVVVGVGPAEALAHLGELGLARLGAVAHGGVDHTDADLARPLAFVVGNEASGLPGAAEPFLDERVRIPIQGRAESLNVGMATAVLCFEAARQRRVAGLLGPARQRASAGMR